MAAVVIPGQPRRWGSESTNFYKNSSSDAPGLPSQQKHYRSTGNQYTNSGHYHVGTKTVNLNPPLDQYGAPSTYKLRTVDQSIPKALATPYVQMLRMAPDKPVDLYQSHRQSHHSYTMATPPLKRSHSASDTDSLARSLSRAFYITSYQSDIAKYAGSPHRASNRNPETLTGQLESRHNSISGSFPTPSPKKWPPRISSAPPTRLRVIGAPPAPAPLPNAPPTPAPPQRRRSFSAIQRSYPSRGEMLKEIFTVFPSPQPQPASRRASRPSSAVSLRRGQIPSLRTPPAHGGWGWS